jgi:hypothetical protein
MTSYRVGSAYTTVPVNAKGSQAVFYPTDERGGTTEDANGSITADAKLVVIYGVVVNATGTLAVSLAQDNPNSLVTNITPTVIGEISFGPVGIGVRGPIKFSVPNGSTAVLTVYWKRIV